MSTGFAVRTRHLTVRYGARTALDDVTVEFPSGGIHGLLGRNGAGKSTLLATLAALRPPTSGQVLVDGEDPFENGRVTERVCIIREGGDFIPGERVAANLNYLGQVRATWDAARAEELVDAFAIDPRQRVQALSRGQRSALGAVVGLASRAPLTIFDEVHLGMDAPTRQRFADELLADVIAYPRTVILSSHLIGEIEHLLEQVVILDRGRVLLAEDAEGLRVRGATLTGPAGQITALTEGLRVIGTRDLATHRQVTVFDDLDGRADQWRDAGLHVGPVGLQDLLIHLTSETAR